MKPSPTKMQTLTLLFFLTTSTTLSSAPRLTIIFVADQFAQHYIQRLYPFFQGGLKEMIDNGIVYENAYHEHAMPATGTGHAALNTGCYPKYHGFIGNKWFDAEGKSIRCTDDNSPSAALFAKNGEYKSGIGSSAKNLVVKGLSDQCILQARPGGTNKVFSLSYKDRAAIGTAGELGKAIWFDSTNGLFTSSKAYFKTLPTWVSTFNKEKKIDQPRTITWSLHYPEETGAYSTHTAQDYKFTSFGKTMINTSIEIPNLQDKKEPYELFALLPESNQLLFDLALTCIDHNLSDNDKLVLWICLSATDKLGHRYGPDSREMFDMIYKLDHQMQQFMTQVEHRVNKRNILYAFTADHGVAPIPELARQEGITTAFRINEKKMVKDLNNLITKKYDIQRLIIGYKTPQFYFDQKKYNKLDAKKQDSIIADIKAFLLTIPGIADVWTQQELLSNTFLPTDIELLYKNQIFPGRSGQLLIRVLPYSQTSKYPSGTAHRTPYEHNTHVPLIFYQKGTLEDKKIYDRVSMLQFANSLAQAITVPSAPASKFPVLPHLFDH